MEIRNLSLWILFEGEIGDLVIVRTNQSYAKFFTLAIDQWSLQLRREKWRKL